MAPPVLPTDDYAAFAKSGTLVISNTAASNYEITQKSIDGLFTVSDKESYDTVLIYAEHVLLQESLNLPGKNVGIFCTQLALGDSKITIDVSGKDGGDLNTKTTAEGKVKTGNDGCNGGSVWLFVQELESSGNLLDCLRIKSRGGSGGKGQNTSVKGETGGAGGAGGNPGSVMFVFGTEVYDAIVRFRNTRKKISALSWRKQISNLCKILTPLPERVEDENFQALALLKDLSWLYAKLQRVHLKAKEASSDIHDEKLTTRYFEIVENITKSLSDFEFEDEMRDLLEALRDGLKDAAPSQGTPFQRGHLENTIATFKLINKVPLELMQGLAFSLNSMIKEINGKAGSAIEVAKGLGGRGGNSGDAASKSGPRGKDGSMAESTLVHCHLRFDGSQADLEAIHAFALPEQCQMLLNKARSHYFSNTKEQIAIASGLYARLIKRLSFVSSLEDSSNSESALARSYTDLETTKKVTFSAISKLKAILGDASRNMNKIVANQDLFGHSPLWVPRTSVSFHKKGVSLLSARLDKVEKLVNNYENAYKAEEKTSDFVTNLVETVKGEVQYYEDQRKELQSDNGPINTCAYKINMRTHKLDGLKKSLKSSLEEAAPYIQDAFQVDYDWVVEVLGTLGTIPSYGPVEGLKSISSVGVKIHKTATEVTDASGQEFKKEFVIKKIKTCGSTFESLKDTVTTDADETLVLSDPGAEKVLASKEDIDTLLEDFKSIIPEYIRNKINKPLNDYIEIVLERNEAVLEYNALISQVAATRDQEAASVSQLSSLEGKSLADLDPNMPAIVFWLRETRDQLRLELMRRLNYESRAIRYWGLLPTKKLAFQEPGPIRGYSEIALAQTKLEKTFEDALEIYSGHSWYTFPDGPDSKGTIYKLSPEEVDQLKTPQKNSKNEEVHLLNLKLTPNHPGLENLANFRINQIRFWLFNASVDALSDDTERRLLTVNICHPGEETILDSTGKEFRFWHGPVEMLFKYDVRGITNIKDTINAKRKKILFGTQEIEKDYTGGGTGNITKDTLASIGPFTTWRIVVSKRENKGLDLSQVTGASIEFCGGGRPPAIAYSG